MTQPIYIHDELIDAIHANRGVVLLETAVLTCGLPTQLWHADFGPRPEELADGIPVHVATMHAMCALVRESGCVPAVAGVLEGKPTLGLTMPEIEQLSECQGKASVSTMSKMMARRESAGTTVSGSLLVASALSAQGLPPIRVFATGGIGGVHLGWPHELDVSADMAALARHPVCVVCAGAKSIIDGRATCELLEALGIPVLGFGTDLLPGFQSIQTPDPIVISQVNDVSEAAAIAKSHWSLPTSGGVLLTQPPPSSTAMDPHMLQQCALAADQAISVQGPARTPALLTFMAEQTQGATLRSNIDLLLSNARLAGSLAHHIACH